MKKQIIIVIGETGEITIQTKGYTGPSCKDASRFIEEALGQKIAEQLTPEYHQQPTNTKNQANQNT